MVEPVELLKVLRPLLTSATKPMLQRLRLPFQIGSAVHREAGRQGIDLTKRQVRKLLKSPAVDHLLKSPHAEGDIEYAAGQIAWTLPGSDREQRERDAEQILALVFWAYLHALNPAAAQAFSATDQTLERLTTASISERQRADARVSFENNLQQFPATLRELPTSIRATWPRIETIAAEMLDPTTRDDKIHQWTLDQPAWMREAPAQVMAWFALLTATDRSRETDFQLWDLARERGFYPRGVAVGFAALAIADADEHRARAYLIEHGDEHPFCVAALAAINRDPDGIIESLARWKDATYLQVHIQVMTAAAHLQRGDTGTGILLATRAWNEHESTGAAVLAAHALVARAQKSGAVARIADCEEAVRLAIGARDKRRVWGGDAVEAAELAIIGLHLVHDAQRAWMLTQAPPAGEATRTEADDPRMAEHAALAAALTGRTTVAQTYVDTALTGFARAYVEAVIAEWNGDKEVALEAWWRSWAEATDDLQRIQAANGLVHAGAGLPDLATARETFPDVVSELGMLAEALSSPDPITYLRARSTTGPLFVVELARLLQEAGAHGEAAQILDDAAMRWSDAVIAEGAARAHLEADDVEAAVTSARRALDLGGASWTGRRRVLGTILDAEAGRQHWAKAITAARQLLAEYPGDIDAQWALVGLLYNSSDLPAAWDALTRGGRSLRPRRRTEIVVWLRLSGRFDTGPSFVDDAIGVVREWSEDEDVFGTFVQVMISSATLIATVSDEQASAIRNSVEAFTQQFPDSTYLRAIPVTSSEDPLEQVKTILAENADVKARAAQEAREGRIPLGLLSTAVGRTYAEASLRRGADNVLAELPSRPEEEDAAAGDAGSVACVIDATAAHTLALLEEATRQTLIGSCRHLIVTESAHRDAFAAREACRMRSTLTVGWNPNTDRPVVTEISDEEAEQVLERAELLLKILGAARRVPHTTLAHFARNFERAASWLSAVDLAKSEGHLLWTDDRVLRQLAASLGVRAFGTVALLDALAASGALASRDRLIAQATLLRNYYVDLPFEAEPFAMAAELDRHQPRGVAAALGRPTAWTNPEQAATFAQQQLRSVQQADPLAIQGWCQAASAGLLLVASADPEKMSNNLAVFLRRCVADPWCTSSALPFVLTGIRFEMAALDGHQVRDPLESALRTVHDAAVNEIGDSGAQNYLMAFVAECCIEDKHTAARVIITAPRR